MQILRKLATIGLILCLFVLVACNKAANNSPGSGPDNPEDPGVTDPSDVPSDDPFVPEYGPDDFKDFPGNFYPEQDTAMEFHDDIDDLFTEYFNTMIELDPQLITSRRFPESVIPSQADRLTPVSFGYKAWQLELAKNTLQVLEQYSDADLTEEQRVNKAILEWSSQLVVDGEKFIYHDVLNLTELLELSVFMQMHHQIESVEDAENFLARLEQIPWVLEQLQANLSIQAEIGCVPPTAVLDNAYALANSSSNLLLQDFLDRVAGLEGKNDLIARCEQIMTDTVKPAYSQLATQIHGLKSQAVHNVSELPGGRDYYALLLRSYTTTDMTPYEVHQVCLGEVARLQKEIRSVVESLGYDGDNYIQVCNDLSEKLIPQDQVQSHYEGLIDMAEDMLPELFGSIPEAPVVIHMGSIRNGYDIPTRDGALPGAFLISPYWKHTEIGAKWFVWHETIPGHHMQFAIEYEADIPYFRDFLFLSGYIEGWGTYGEMLPFEYGLVEDPESYLSSLNRYLMLAARVVMDTGVNYVGWSEEKAGRYFSNVTGLDYQSWMADVISRPGRSAAYYAGMYKIRELREKAKSELGDAYDVRDFHDLVLKYGSMPIDVLEELVEAYIQENK